jgi:hypothetical protein
MVLQAVNSNGAWWRSTCMLRDWFLWVLPKPYCEESGILHHRWINHVDQKMIDQMLQPLLGGQDCYLEGFLV